MFYFIEVRGDTIPSSSDCFPCPVVVCDLVFRRTHRDMLHDMDEVLVAFQDYEVRPETRKRIILPASTLDHPIVLREYVDGTLADMNVDPVPPVWECMARSIIGSVYGLAQEHGSTCSLAVKADLEIRTEGYVYLTTRSAASESTRRRLMETAFVAGSNDIPKYGDLDDSCSVCLDELHSGTELTKTPCDHIFHKECILRWLENGNSCPLCRFQSDRIS